MGKQTEYLKGKEEYKGRLLRYLEIRRDSIQVMMQEGFTKNGAINQRQMEVYFSYNAIIKDVKNNKLD